MQHLCSGNPYFILWPRSKIIVILAIVSAKKKSLQMLPVSEKAEVISITETMHEACVSTQCKGQSVGLTLVEVENLFLQVAI